MKVYKEGGRQIFEKDQETEKTVSKMLLDLEKNGMDAVRKYSKNLDGWNPECFELSDNDINKAISKCDDDLIKDTDYCQNNVRTFAKQQYATLNNLETEIRPGIVLGHKHIPVNCVGSYIPGGRYPMFGSAQMSIIPAKVAGVKSVVSCTPPLKGEIRADGRSFVSVASVDSDPKSALRLLEDSNDANSSLMV